MNIINDGRPKRKRPSKCANKMRNALLHKKQKREVQCCVTGIEKEVSEEHIVPLNSSSNKKLSYFTKLLDNNGDSGDNSDSYMIVHSSLWQKIFEGCVCAACGCGGLYIEIQQSMGFAHKLVSKCRNCQSVCSEMFTSPRIQTTESTRPPFEVNRKVVNAFLHIGKGHAAIEQFSMAMNLPIMSVSTYSAHVHNLAEENEKIKNEVLKISHSAIR